MSTKIVIILIVLYVVSLGLVIYQSLDNNKPQQEQPEYVAMYPGQYIVRGDSLILILVVGDSLFAADVYYFGDLYFRKGK